VCQKGRVCAHALWGQGKAAVKVAQEPRVTVVLDLTLLRQVNLMCTRRACLQRLGSGVVLGRCSVVC
jgi:hypothetical protein